MKKDLTPIARKLRKIRNPHEVRLWARLRNRRFFGLKFHRQFPIGPYVVDFCCRERSFIIEVDGGGHAEPAQKQKDKKRDDHLRSEGFRVIRVSSTDLHASIEDVLEYIATFL